jgi:hypothetical protein
MFVFLNRLVMALVSFLCFQMQPIFVFVLCCVGCCAFVSFGFVFRYVCVG